MMPSTDYVGIPYLNINGQTDISALIQHHER